MSWTAPRTWVAAETVTAALLQAHVSANMDVLKTYHTDEGHPRTALACFAYSGSLTDNNTNAAGGGDTAVPGYDVTIPANFLKQAGDAIVGLMTLVAGATAEASSCKVLVGAAGTKVTLMTSSTASTIIPVLFRLTYRTSTTAAVFGWAWQGAAAAGNPTPYALASAGVGTIDWTTSQDLQLFLVSNTNNQLLLTDYTLWGVRAMTGDAATS